MPIGEDSRYRRVSRRAVLKSSLGVGFVVVAGTACGNQDSEVFAGSVAEPLPPTTTTTTTTSAPTTTAAASNSDAESNPTTTAPRVFDGQPAVNGEMVVAFTFTQGAGGRNEHPYVVVWIEDTVGNLVTTVALYYEQSRRGSRWLDHLDKWYPADAARVAAGGENNRATISSATRAAGEYLVAWDGTADGVRVSAGDYFICIESVREEGPLSLICEPITLNGELQVTPLPDTGELSMASVQINV